MSLRIGDLAPDFTQDSTGGVIIVPSLQDAGEIAKLFPKGYKTVKPYLRITPQPNKTTKS